MSLNLAFEGRSYPPTAPYAVGREKLREFARAVGAENPVHHDVETAREAGYDDVIAVPTFAVVLAQPVERQLIADPDAGIDFSRVVHGEEKFTHHRPLTVGDEVTGTLHVDRMRLVGGHGMVTTRVELALTDGTPVSTVVSSIVVRGED